MADPHGRGAPGDEIHDGGFNLHHPRRRSNSFKDPTRDFKTKFETVEPEPVLEDEGFEITEGDETQASEDRSDGAPLDQVDTMSKGSFESGESVDEAMKKM